MVGMQQTFHCGVGLDGTVPMPFVDRCLVLGTKDLSEFCYNLKRHLVNAMKVIAMAMKHQHQVLQQ
jgi:hypothetical protein